MMLVSNGVREADPSIRGQAVEEYGGLDVSLEQISICVVDGSREIVIEAKVDRRSQIWPRAIAT